MRNLILGIIAVVCVQMAFIAHVKLQSPLQLAAAPDQQEFPIVSADMSWLREFDRYALYLPSPEPDSDASRYRRPDFSATRSKATGNRDKLKARMWRSRSDRVGLRYPALFARDHERSNRGEFETIVITYDRNPDPPPCDRPPVTGRKRRSPAVHIARAINPRWELVRSESSKLY